MQQLPWKFDGLSGTSRLLLSCLQQRPSHLLWKHRYLRVSAIASELCSLGARIEAIVLCRIFEGVLIKPARGLQRDSRLA